MQKKPAPPRRSQKRCREEMRPPPRPPQPLLRPSNSFSLWSKAGTQGEYRPSTTRRKNYLVLGVVAAGGGGVAFLRGTFFGFAAGEPAFFASAFLLKLPTLVLPWNLAFFW